MTYALPSTEVRANIAGILKRIREEGSTCFITQKGRATAALLPLELYNQLISDLEDRIDETDGTLGKEIREARREYRAKKLKTLGQALK